MRLSRTAALMFAAAMALVACGRARQTTKLAYPGNPRATLAPLEAEIAAQGYKPVCKEDEYCHFMVGEEVRVHFKVGGRDVALAVDVLNAKEMAEAKVAELTANGEKIGRGIWEKARVAAAEREKDAAERAKADEAKQAEAAKQSPSSGGVTAAGVLDLLNKVQVSTGQGQPAGGGGAAAGGASGEASCCVNGAFYSCPSVAAVNKCGGETAACMSKCMSSSDMSCPDKCLAEHPPDPSGCTRDASRDVSCRK